jgi:fatty acid desaturase
MELRPIASYTKALRPLLPPETFEPARSRLLWLPLHVAVIATLAWSMSSRWLPVYLWPVAAILIGLSLSGITFLGHEVLHGQIVRGRKMIRFLGWICMSPFLVSPTLWTNWHNRVHHNHTAHVGRDPDMYPTIEEYREQTAARIMADYFGLGGRRWRSVIALMFGFTGQSQQMLWNAQNLKIMSPKLHRRSLIEFGLMVAMWTGIAFLVGGWAFIFVFAIPLMIANVIVMSFIFTNHCLSALTPHVNDPLVNSLSVTLPRFFEWLSLDFGFHVEHHVMPTVSNRHGRVIREKLRELSPERYQSMSLIAALRQLYLTGRVYHDNVTLIEPRDGYTSPTLLPGSSSDIIAA